MTIKDLITSPDGVNHQLALQFLFNDYGKSFETFMLAVKLQYEHNKQELLKNGLNYENLNDYVLLNINDDLRLNVFLIFDSYYKSGIVLRVMFVDNKNKNAEKIFQPSNSLIQFKVGFSILDQVLCTIKEMYQWLDYNNLLPD